MKKLLLVTALFLSSNLIADEVPESEITYIGTWEPWIDIRVNSTAVDPEKCGEKGIYRIDLIEDTAAKEKLSVILSAYYAKKPIGLNINGCVGAYPKINAVRLGSF